MPQRHLSEHKSGWLFGVIVLFYLLSGIAYLRTQSVTSDENSFYLYAKRFVRGHPERLDPATDDSKTPIVVLNLLPRAIGQLIQPGLHKTDNGETDLLTARYITLFFSVLTLWLVYHWAMECFGGGAAVLAAFLMALEPNFLASAALVTTDAYSTFFLLSVLYCLWKLLKLRSWRWLVIFSVAVACTQLVKQSLLLLYFLLPVLILSDIVRTRNTSVRRLIKPLLAFIFIQWLVINLGYYFFGTNGRLGDYHFFSTLFQGIQHTLPGGFRIPLPAPYLQSFDMTRYYDEIGGGYAGKSGFGNVTILGQAGRGHGFWYYYFVSLLFKAPVTFMILLVWAVMLAVRRKQTDRTTLVCLLAAPVFFLLYFSFFYRVQVGVRHIIFLIPMLCIFLSSVLTAPIGPVKRILLPLLSAYLFFSYLFYWQHQYSYTNEFVTDKTFAYRYVGAANIDFRQGLYWARKYMATHPGIQWGTGEPRPGRFLIPVDEYMDIYNQHKLDWLTSHPPYGHVGFSNLLVEVRPEDLTPVK